MIYKLFARQAVAPAVDARIREIIAALDEDKIALYAQAPADEVRAPRLIEHVQTRVTACSQAPDWAEITVGFGTLDVDISSDLWGFIVVPRTLRTFSMTEVSVVGPGHPTMM
ncbi:hypothetical protein [Methylobacterium nodulans]|uniref:Uncharacterized protein n=1 Tax=Methylobacterium nodulans (strain LMG 21967 / CNCM I-2342 / ORS 2060) TaxID=460265 RepID=B8IW27_METNO|nr:hypothetical protein [Methylobacterium nodulans]ACL62617.1 hypothetical protein Mnod_8521 [Methylobacterium nodulans ORS 2060]